MEGPSAGLLQFPITFFFFGDYQGVEAAHWRDKDPQPSPQLQSDRGIFTGVSHIFDP